MKCIIDAQLPKRLALFLGDKGFEAIHTLDLPLKNKTSDTFIGDFANNENRIVITKDLDFLHSYLVKKIPKKLPLVRTGNISNNELISMFSSNFELIVDLINQHDLIEIRKDQIVYLNLDS